LTVDGWSRRVLGRRREGRLAVAVAGGPDPFDARPHAPVALDAGPRRLDTRRFELEMVDVRDAARGQQDAIERDLPATVSVAPRDGRHAVGHPFDEAVEHETEALRLECGAQLRGSVRITVRREL